MFSPILIIALILYERYSTDIMIKRIISTISFIVSGVVLVCCVFPLMLLFFLIDWTDTINNFIARKVLVLISICTGLRLRVQGGDTIPRGRSLCIVANHQSAMDIFIMARVLKEKFTFLSKRELFYIPIVGWNMYFAGYIPINRSRISRAYKAVQQAISLQSGGRGSLVMFPEGTRTLTHEVKKFKPGFVRIARDAGVSILPLTINGALRFKRKGEFLYNPCTVSVTVHPVIETSHFSDEDWKSLCGRVEATIRSAYT